MRAREFAELIIVGIVGAAADRSDDVGIATRLP
jgi:hypothetical protein